MGRCEEPRAFVGNVELQFQVRTMQELGLDP